MTLTLIGYRGTGKSSVAAPLAARLGFTSIDADAEIERRAGHTIREIFANEGESAFRQRERAVLEELFARDRLVIAAGGGAVLDATTRGRMRTAGPVIWLRASVDAIERRIAEDVSTASRRPALTALGGRREIEATLAIREPLYRECAGIIVDTDGRSIDEIVEQILSQLTSLPEGSGT